jgi:WD40 repeat protein
MLTGKLPIGAFVLPSKANSSLNSDWDKLITTMLQQDPRDRPQSMNDVIENVKSIQSKKRKTIEFSIERVVESFFYWLIYPFVWVFNNKKVAAILGTIALICLLIFAGTQNPNDKKEDNTTETVVSVEENIPAQPAISTPEVPINNSSKENIPKYIKLEGHTDTVLSAAFSPDGKKIVTASSDKTARIWDAATGKELKKLEGHTDIVLSAAFSPDGKTVVTANGDKTARIWDAATGKELKALEGHTDNVISAAFSPDGKKIVTASLDHTARIWDAATGKELHKLEGSPAGLNSALFSPDGKKVVTTDWGATVLIWDAATGKELQKLEGHTPQKYNGNTNCVYSAAFSPDGKTIVTASSDETARIWDAVTGNELQKLEGHTDSVKSAAFSRDGKTVITTSDDRTIRIWDVVTGKELKKLDRNTVTVFFPDTKWLLQLMVINFFYFRLGES